MQKYVLGIKIKKMLPVPASETFIVPSGTAKLVGC